MHWCVSGACVPCLRRPRTSSLLTLHLNLATCLYVPVSPELLKQQHNHGTCNWYLQDVKFANKNVLNMLHPNEHKKIVHPFMAYDIYLKMKLWSVFKSTCNLQLFLKLCTYCCSGRVHEWATSCQRQVYANGSMFGTFVHRSMARSLSVSDVMVVVDILQFICVIAVIEWIWLQQFVAFCWIIWEDFMDNLWVLCHYIFHFTGGIHMQSSLVLKVFLLKSSLTYSTMHTHHCYYYTLSAMCRMSLQFHHLYVFQSIIHLSVNIC